MLLNYFKIALRNLQKNKLFSIINISSMAISLASSFLISLFVWDELKFDRHHPDGDRTFRVYNIRQSDDGVVNYLPIVPYPFATYMQKDFPEIESVTISPWMYVKACGMILVITLMTVSFQSIRAALSNPAQVLKSE